MCRMMGIVSEGPVHYDLFEEFAVLAVRGMCPLGAPDERGHRDGWGLACFEDGSLKLHARDVGSAVDSSKYHGNARKIARLKVERAPGRCLVVLGHLRRASHRERVATKWSHPFLAEHRGVTWAFEHNGSFQKELADPERIDSQILFEAILDNLDGQDHESVSTAVAAARTEAIRSHEGFTSLNLMLTDGRALHLYRDFQTNGEYYTLYQDRFREMVIAASEPILAMKAEPLPRGVLHTVTPDLEIARTPIA